MVVREEELGDLLHILETFSQERIFELRQQVSYIWEKYFSSPKTIALTTLQIINDRVFPWAGRSYEEWNDRPNPVRFDIFIHLKFLYYTFV